MKTCTFETMRWAVIAAAMTLAPLVAAPGQQRDVAGGTATAMTPASVSGTVTGRTPDVHVRRVIVTLVGSGMPSTRSVVTDDDGHFTFSKVPQGQYTVVATKAGFLPSAYGATHPGRPGTPLQLRPGLAMTISIGMTRGSAIEGTLRDESGAAASGVTVFALDARSPDVSATPGSSPPVTATTDDRGLYRIFGLAPGRYIIAATMRSVGEGPLVRRTDGEVEAIVAALERPAPGRTVTSNPTVSAEAVAYAPTYFPGVTRFNAAQTVDVAAEEERLGVDFAVAPVRTGTIAGTITSADATPSAHLQLSIVPAGPRVFAPDNHPVLVERPTDTGRFRYTSVPPGRYTLLARGDGGAEGPPSFGMTDLDVSDQGVVDVAMSLRRGVTVAGRVRFVSATPRTPDVTSVNVNLKVPGGAYMTSYRDGTVTGTALISSSPSHPAADGTFALHGVAPWTYAFEASMPASRAWWLRSAMLNGRDLLDEPFVVSGDDISGIDVTFTDQQNVLSGQLRASLNTPAPEYYVVVVPADGRPWREGSRRFAFVRPASDGRFRLTNLPAGNYLLGALADFDVEDFSDAALIAQLTSQAIKVTVLDGRETVQAIELAR